MLPKHFIQHLKTRPKHFETYQNLKSLIEIYGMLPTHITKPFKTQPKHLKTYHTIYPHTYGSAPASTQQIKTHPEHFMAHNNGSAPASKKTHPEHLLADNK